MTTNNVIKQISGMDFPEEPTYIFGPETKIIVAKCGKFTAQAQILAHNKNTNLEIIAREILCYTAIAQNLGVDLAQISITVAYDENRVCSTEIEYPEKSGPADEQQYFILRGTIMVRQKYSSLRDSPKVVFKI